MSEHLDAETDIAKIKIPPPPVQRKEHQEYWMIYGEWTEFMQIGGSALVTPENPTPQGPQIVRRTVGVNECIDVPPVVFHVLAQAGRAGYQIKWAVRLTKEHYLWYKEVEKVWERAAKAAQQKAEADGEKR